MNEAQLIRVTVNGEPHELVVPARRSLADVLRDDIGLTGTHVGCEHGVCGACTVLVDGVPARSCLILAPQADERSIETVEGLAADGEVSALQRAFSEHHGLQCGFCTPGFLMLAVGLLREIPQPSEDVLRDALSSNLCRCTGYAGIVEAVRAVAADPT
ncbi:MAG: (2Fe-2S)-binding protein [Solirubrobacteraceae bacterium]